MNYKRITLCTTIRRYTLQHLIISISQINIDFLKIDITFVLKCQCIVLQLTFYRFFLELEHDTIHSTQIVDNNHEFSCCNWNDQFCSLRRKRKKLCNTTISCGSEIGEILNLCLVFGGCILIRHLEVK